jgi:hyperosmotically inducible protein
MNARALAIVLMAGLSLSAIAQTGAEQPRHTRYDQETQRQVTQDLQKKDALRGITADVEEGIVTLSGEVNLYIEKVNAEKRVRKIKNVDGVRNHVEVEGAEISDADLLETLSNKLRYDRVGYGIVFNSLTVAVEGGMVTVGGNVRDYPDRDSAVAIVATTPGVRDVVDEIEVAPLSAFDDNLRVRLARAIYGHTSLQKYALDPQGPIRIVVENGNVELAGVVLNAGDRQVAYMQASSVPGVFSVRNNLMVATKADR